MKAVLIDRAGAPARIVHLPDPPPPGPGEVLVAMRRAPINPADLLTIAGRYAAVPDHPFVPGAEGVGEVVALGAEVRSVRIGDRVLPLSRGNWASHRLVTESELISVPDDVPLEQAAMIRINPATAWRLLDCAELRAGDHIVQNGAGSMVARWVRALASARSYRVIDVVRAGADDPARHCLVDGPDLAERVADLARGARVPLALDCVAGDASGRLAAALSPGGTMVVFGHLSGDPCSMDSQLLTGRAISVRGFSLRPAEAGSPIDQLRALYRELFSVFRSGNLAVPIAAVHPLDEIEPALQRAAGGGPRVMLALDR